MPGGELNTWPPIRLSYTLPPHILVRQDTPVLGWWDSDTNTWRMDGLSNIEYNKESRVITLHTIHPAPISMLQRSHVDLPLTDWRIATVSRSLAVLTLQAHVMQVQIEIGEGYCRLLQPVSEELEVLNTSKSLSPGLLLQVCIQRGQNMMWQRD